MQVEGYLPSGRETGARVRNTYATYPVQGDSLPKGRLIPHNNIGLHGLIFKVEAVQDGHADD
jgi:hypothetical protein